MFEQKKVVSRSQTQLSYLHEDDLLTLGSSSICRE